MNKIQSDNLGMLQLVSAQFNDHQAEIVAVVPAFAAQKVLFDGLLASIYESATEADGDLSGYTVSKAESRKALLEATQRVGMAGILYHTHVAPNPMLADRLRTSTRTVNLKTDAALLVNATAVHQVCDGVKALLTPYGISAAQVDALLALITGFEGEHTSPREARAEANRHKRELQKRLLAANALLRETIDPMMSMLQSTNHLLYRKYRLSRKMRQSANRRAADKPYKTMLHPGSTKALQTQGKSIKATTTLRLSCHTKEVSETVTFFFASSPTDEPTDGMSRTLGALEKTAATATELGWSAARPTLFARNNGHSLHTAGVLVG